MSVSSLLFIGSDGNIYSYNGSSVTELSNGSSNPAFSYDPIFNGQPSAAVVGNLAYLVLPDSTGNTSAIWSYNGTSLTQITSSLDYVYNQQDSNNPSEIMPLAAFGSDLAFSQATTASNGSGNDYTTLAIYDPSTNLITQPSSPNGGYNPHDFVTLNNVLYFEATDSATNSTAIYSYSGGTVTEIYNLHQTISFNIGAGPETLPGPGSVSGNLVSFNGSLYFGSGEETVYKLTSTGSLSNAATDVAPSTQQDGNPAVNLFVVGNYLYYQGDSTGDYVINTSNQASLILGDSGASSFIPVNDGGTLYFTGFNFGAFQEEIYTSSGGGASIKDASAILSDPVVYNGVVYFSGSAGLATYSGGSSVGSVSVPTAADPGAPLIVVPFAATAWNSVVTQPAPTVSSIDTVGASPNNASTEQFAVTFSEAVTGFTASSFTLVDTGTVTGSIGAIGGGGAIYYVTVTGVTGDGTMGLDVPASGSGIVSSPDGVALASAYTSGQTYTIRHTPPSVTSVSVPANATYIAGQNLNFTVNFSEAVTVTGTPELPITLTTGGTVDAQYVSGSGTSALTFRYTVVGGEQDPNGIALGGALVANGGAIKDSVGNDATLTLNSVASTSGVLVDSIPPTVSSIVPAGASLNNSSSDAFTVTFSKPVTGVAASDFAIAPTGTVAGAVQSVSGSGTVWTVTVGSVSGDGTLGLNLVSSAGIVDYATNPLASYYSGGPTYTIDHTAPTVVVALLVTVAQNGAATLLGIAAPSDNETPTPSLAIAVTSLPSDGTVTLADGVTPVAVAETLTLAQLAGLEFKPGAGLYNQNSTFTYSVTDLAGNQSLGSVAVDVGAPGTPTISGAGATSISAGAASDPFAHVTIADPSAGATETLTITASGAAGALSGAGLLGSGTVASPYQLTGSATTVTNELDQLVFTPVLGTPNTSVHTSFTLSDQGSVFATPVTDANTIVSDAFTGVAPTISGAAANQSTSYETPDSPFSGVTISDPNGGSPTDTLTIALSGAAGTLSGAGFAFAGGHYSMTGTAAAITQALEALSFTPAADWPNASGKTTFTLTDISSVFAAPATDATTTVVNNDPNAIVASAAYVAAHLDGIAADANVTSIDLSDPGIPMLTLTSIQAANDATALGKIANELYGLDVGGSTTYFANGHLTDIPTLVAALTNSTVELLRNSQENVYGAGNNVTFASGVAAALGGGGDTANITAGDSVGVWNTNGSVDWINGSNCQFGSNAANGAGTGIWVTAGAQANVTGSNDGVSFGSGASGAVSGGGDTIDVTSGVSLGVSNAGGAADWINGGGDSFGGSAANGAATGIWVAVGAQANVAGSNDGVSFAANASGSVSGGGNTIAVTSGVSVGVSNTNGVVDDIAGSNCQFGTTSASGANPGVWLGTNVQANVSGTNDGIAVSSGDSLAVWSDGDTVLIGGSSSVATWGNNETYAFQPKFGNDVIWGFNATDAVQLSQSDFANLSALLGHISQSGSDTVISLDASDSIMLKNVSLGSLLVSQFHLV